MAGGDERALDVEPKDEETVSSSGPGANPEAHDVVIRKRGRRATTDAVPGSDPTPAPVDRRHDSSDNDGRLKADKPPHWG